MNVRVRPIAAVLALVVAATLLAGCGPHGISGDYLAKDDGSVSLLQITQSGDHDLRGSIAVTGYNRDYSLDRGLFTFTGAVQDGQIAIAARGGPGNLTGVVDGNSIKLETQASLLSAAQSVTFVRSSEAAYKSAVATMQVDAPKRAAEAVAKRKQAAADSAADMDIWQQANDLSMWAGQNQAYPINNDLAAEAQDIKNAKDYADRGYPWGKPHNMTVDDYFRGEFQKHQDKLAQDILKLEQDMQTWNGKISSGPCSKQPSRYEHCKTEFDAEAKYKLAARKLTDTITGAETTSTAQARELLAVIQSHSTETH